MDSRPCSRRTSAARISTSWRDKNGTFCSTTGIIRLPSDGDVGKSTLSRQFYLGKTVLQGHGHEQARRENQHATKDCQFANHGGVLETIPRLLARGSVSLPDRSPKADHECTPAANDRQ